jgi:GGDEF domain-containing protein
VSISDFGVCDTFNKKGPTPIEFLKSEIKNRKSEMNKVHTPLDTNLPLLLAFLSLNEQATRDWLTGLYNRRYFEETLTDHIESATRYSRELLRDTARKADILCRYGGDEFAVILPETSLANAQQFSERICQALEETSRRGAGPCVQGGKAAAPPPIHISATAGLAALPCENLVSAADADLLMHKRNR